MKHLILNTLLLFTSTFAIELTPETWDTETSGKTTFIKFFAPWCGHCKKMKPAWDQLMTEYKDHPTILIADVDCIGAGKELCSQVGVKGFPTVKFGDVNDLQDYQGGRDLASLQDFSKNLKPACSISNQEHCSEAEVEQIQHLFTLDISDLTTFIKTQENKQEEAEITFKASVTSLQQEYEKLVSTKETALKEVKESGLSLYKAMLKEKKKTDKEEL